MPEPVSPLCLEFLDWISNHHRTYVEVMKVWRSSSPRHTVWEDALADGLIEVGGILDQSEVTVTVLGATILEANQKPQLTRSDGNTFTKSRSFPVAWSGITPRDPAKKLLSLGPAKEKAAKPAGEAASSKQQAIGLKRVKRF